MKKAIFNAVLLVALLVSSATSAHEVRPALLQIRQTTTNSYRVTWKLPTSGSYSIHLVPHLSNNWLDRAPASQYVSSGFLVRTWNITATSKVPALDGTIFWVNGLQSTITDVFVSVRLFDGQQFETIVHPGSPRIELDFGKNNGISTWAYLLLGIKHILSGPDHLLFVLGLVLIVRSRRTLIETITAFTIAHSITLACATLGNVSFSVALLNALIALSILFLAPECIRARRGGRSFTTQYPWLVAFVFGLLHGMGFASGLRSIGMERGHMLLALLSFNIGVEIGQLAFVIGILGLKRSFRLMEIDWWKPAQLAPSYVIGASAAYWTFSYGTMTFGGL